LPSSVLELLALAARTADIFGPNAPIKGTLLSTEVKLDKFVCMLVSQPIAMTATPDQNCAQRATGPKIK
jgi:hypothetical protein